MYCQQFNAPPVVPRSKATVTFMRRCNAKLLRTYVEEPDGSEDIGCDFEVIQPELCRDWARKTRKRSWMSFFDGMKSSDLAKPHSTASTPVSTPSLREQVLAGVSLRRVAMKRDAGVVLTMEGTIKLVRHRYGQHELCSPSHIQEFVPTSDSRFVDVQLQGDHNLTGFTALSDHGALYRCSYSDKENVTWSRMRTMRATNFTMTYMEKVVVYSSSEGLTAEFEHKRERKSSLFPLEEDQFPKDFVGIMTPDGYKIVMLMPDSTMQLLEFTSRSNRMSQDTYSLEQYRADLKTVEDLVELGDRLYSIAGHTGSQVQNGRVWILTEKGRLIECCFGSNGVAAGVYKGLEGIVSISLSP